MGRGLSRGSYSIKINGRNRRVWTWLLTKFENGLAHRRCVGRRQCHTGMRVIDSKAVLCDHHKVPPDGQNGIEHVRISTMYERFTDCARRVMQLAVKEAPPISITNTSAPNTSC